MKVRNVHERNLPSGAARVGELLDGLASPEDPLWPRDRWPAMRLDRPLQVGGTPHRSRWSRWVRLLRWALGGGRYPRGSDS